MNPRRHDPVIGYMTTTILFCRAALLVLVAGIASACSSTHDYTNSKPENLILKPDVRSGSARLHVYDVGNTCNLIYQGTVELSGSKVKVGIPVNKLSYLEINFSDSSIFIGSHSTFSGVYLSPRDGYQYETAVSYIDRMYSVTIYEQDMHGGARHEVTSIAPKACASK